MSTTATTPEAHVATVTEIYEAFGRGDIPAILDRLAPDVAWDVLDIPSAAQDADVPWLRPIRGRDNVPSFFAALGEHMEFHDFQVRGMVASGDTVVAEIALDISSKADGTRLWTDEAHVWTFAADGRVASYRHYADTARHIELAKAGGSGG